MPAPLTHEKAISNPKYIAEAKAIGLELIGLGRNSKNRTYKWKKCGHINVYTTGGVRSGAIRCQDCLDESRIAQAEAIGLKLIGKSTKGKHYRRYLIKECGHTGDYALSSVRNHGFVKCSQCFEEKHQKEAKNAGLIILGKSQKGKDHRYYQHIKCGHKKDYQLANVRIVKSGELKCTQCIDDYYKEAAKELGFKLIGDSNKLNHRKYKCLTCGEISERRDSNIRTGQGVCYGCARVKHEKMAQKRGLVLLGEGKSCSYRLYKFSECGHVRELTLSSVAKNEFTCNQCQESHWDKEKSLYLFEINHKNRKWLKLGITKEIDSRLTQFGLPKNAKTELIYSLIFEDGHEAHEAEKRLSKQFKNFNLCHDEMKRLQDNGYTECYDISIKDELWDSIDEMAV